MSGRICHISYNAFAFNLLRLQALEIVSQSSSSQRELLYKRKGDSQIKINRTIQKRENKNKKHQY